MQRALVDVLLGLCVAAELLCCLGLVAARTVFDRLHYAGAATTVGPFLVAAAVLVEEGWTLSGINALLAAVLLLVLNGVLTHATARVARIRRYGSLEPCDGEIERGR